MTREAPEVRLDKRKPREKLKKEKEEKEKFFPKVAADSIYV